MAKCSVCLCFCIVSYWSSSNPCVKPTSTIKIRKDLRRCTVKPHKDSKQKFWWNCHLYLQCETSTQFSHVPRKSLCVETHYECGWICVQVLQHQVRHIPAAQNILLSASCWKIWINFRLQNFSYGSLYSPFKLMNFLKMEIPWYSMSNSQSNKSVKAQL